MLGWRVLFANDAFDLYLERDLVFKRGRPHPHEQSGSHNNNILPDRLNKM